MSPFPAFPVPFSQAVFYSPIFSGGPSPGTFWGAFPQRSECAYIPKCLWSSTSSCIVQSGRPSIIWVLGFALCVGVCFSCFLTCILFGGVGISLSRWSPSQDILQSIYEPETTRNFFLLTQEGPSFPSCCQFFLKISRHVPFAKQLSENTHIHMDTHIVSVVKTLVCNKFLQRHTAKKRIIFLFRKAVKPSLFCDFVFQTSPLTPRNGLGVHIPVWTAHRS